MKSLADECLDKVGEKELEVTQGGRQGPYRSVDDHNRYNPTQAECGYDARRGKKDED